MINKTFASVISTEPVVLSVTSLCVCVCERGREVWFYSRLLNLFSLLYMSIQSVFLFFLFEPLQPGQEQSEFSILLRDLETCNTDTRMCARKVRVQHHPALAENIQSAGEQDSPQVYGFARTSVCLHTLSVGANQWSRSVTCILFMHLTCSQHRSREKRRN